MAARNLTPKRLRLTADTVSAPPWLALVEGRLGGRPGLRAEPLFAARHPDGTPTQEMNALYGFYRGGGHPGDAEAAEPL